MTTYETLVTPELTVTDLPGWCLRYAQKTVGAPAWYASAWEAWLNAPGRHGTHDPMPTDAPHFVWFSHYGRYGDPPRYDNWGHVVLHVPGDAFYSSPAAGKAESFTRLGDLAAVEATYNAKYVGWSEGIHNVRICRPKPKGPLMALTDTQQADLLRKVNNIHEAIFKESPTKLTPRAPGGLLYNVGQLHEAIFKTTPTSRDTPGGVLMNQKLTLDELEQLLAAFEQLRDALNDVDARD